MIDKSIFAYIGVTIAYLLYAQIPSLYVSTYLTKEEAANWKRKYVYQINDESLFNYLKKNNYPSWFYKEIRNDVIEKNMSVQESFNLRKERYYAKI